MRNNSTKVEIKQRYVSNGDLLCSNFENYFNSFFLYSFIHLLIIISRRNANQLNN